MDALKPNVDVIIRACELLMESETLKAFLRYVLHTGNFINAVRFRLDLHLFPFAVRRICRSVTLLPSL